MHIARRGAAFARWTLAVVVVGVVAAACGTGNQTPGTAASSTEATVTQGPGTPLFGGLEVVEGSYLLGTTFPGGESEFFASEVTRALLGVDRDLADVLADYAAAMDQLGYRVDSQSCGSTGEPRVTACVVTGSAADGASLRVDAVTPGGESGGFATLLRIQFTDAPDGATASAFGSTTADDGSDTAAETAPGTSDPFEGDAGGHTAIDDIEIPIAGQVIAPDWMSQGLDVRVESGTTLLAPAAPFGAGCPGWATVARIDGDASEAQQGYLRQVQFSAGSEDDTDTAERRIDGRLVITSTWSGAEGTTLGLSSVADTEGAWYLLFEVEGAC